MDASCACSARDSRHGTKYWAMSQGFGGPDKEGFMAGFIAVMG